MTLEGFRLPPCCLLPSKLTHLIDSPLVLSESGQPTSERKVQLKLVLVEGVKVHTVRRMKSLHYQARITNALKTAILFKTTVTLEIR